MENNYNNYIDEDVLNGLVSSVPATEDGLDSLMENIIYRHGKNRINPYIIEKRNEDPKFRFMPYAREILKKFDVGNTEYWNLVLNQKNLSDSVRDQMREYVLHHDINNVKTQAIFFLLARTYISKCLFDEVSDLIAIAETAKKKTSSILNLLIEYYCKTLNFEKAAEYVKEYEKQYNSGTLLFANFADSFYSETNFNECVKNYEKWKEKPFWPRGTNLENYIKYLDCHGLKHAGYYRNEVKLSEFSAPEIAYDNLPDSFCTIECSNVFTTKVEKHTYRIASVKVVNGKVTQKYCKLVRPRCGQAELSKISKKTGVPLEQFTSLPLTDQCIDELLLFIGDLPLVSIDWNAKDNNTFDYFCRAIRKGGIKELTNPLFDLIYVAEDQDIIVDSRKELLDYFHLDDSQDILEKAQVDVKCAEQLRK